MSELLSTNIGLIGDIAVAVCLLISAFISMGKGFVRCLVGFVGTFLSIILAFVFCKVVASYLQDWFSLLDTLSGYFTEQLSKIDALNVDVSANLSTSLTETGIPGFIVRIIVESFTDTNSVKAGTTAAQLVAPVVSQMILLIFSFIGIFCIVKIIALILNGTISKAVESIPVVKSVNALLGFVLGLLEALFTLYLFLYFFTILPVDFVVNFISQTTFLKSLYDNNVLGLLAQWFISSDWLTYYIGNI